ncbi:putative lipoyltransferase 2, mitochondrial, partial [Cichlidogyrus casuarinus]
MRGSGIVWFVKALESVGLKFCEEEFGLCDLLRGSEKSDNIGETGVWANADQKLMAIGIHRTRHITYHGMAINVCEQPLEYFAKIVPCGLEGKEATSISRHCDPTLTERLSVAKCAETIIPYFDQVWRFDQETDTKLYDLSCL